MGISASEAMERSSALRSGTRGSPEMSSTTSSSAPLSLKRRTALIGSPTYEGLRNPCVRYIPPPMIVIAAIMRAEGRDSASR